MSDPILSNEVSQTIQAAASEIIRTVASSLARQQAFEARLLACTSEAQRATVGARMEALGIAVPQLPAIGFRERVSTLSPGRGRKANGEALALALANGTADHVD